MNKRGIIAIGDNVVDKYLSQNMMYPGGQCLNICVYSHMNGGDPAFLGKFGSNRPAQYNCQLLTDMGIDFSHSRHYNGPNGEAWVKLSRGERIFLGSNKGGVAKEHPFDFTQTDLDYISGFRIIYSNTNSYTADDLPLLAKTGVPIAFDFSTIQSDDWLTKVCPHASIVLLSCAHQSDTVRETVMLRVAAMGVRMVVGTVGERGSFVLYDREMVFAPARINPNAVDTMGAGDSYFSALLTNLLQSGDELFEADHSRMIERIRAAMQAGAAFSSKICGLNGAFGYGIPIEN